MKARGAAVGAALALVLGVLLSPATASAAPANDNFANPRVLEGEEVETSGVTFGATKEAGEPNHAGDPGGASVWFAWTAPRAERVVINSCSPGWTSLTAVYRGDTLSGLETVGSASSLPSATCPEFSFRANSGTTYRIAIDGYSDGGAIPVETGSYELTLRTYIAEMPGNDAFAAATDLGSREYAWLWGSTEGATREPGEPGHPTDLEGASVWYRWTAPRSERMEAFPCRGTFHPVTSVFAGTEIASAAPVSAPSAPGNGPQCSLGGFPAAAFDAVAGTTYSISVDGAEGEWGLFGVQLQPVPVPFVDDSPPSTRIRKLRVHGRRVTIRFVSESGATFLCRLDKRPFAPCASPKTYRHLALGGHRFLAKAVDLAGNVDSSPALVSFKVRKR